MVVRVGLLGSGFAAEFHMQSYAEIPNAKVVAVASRSRAAEFARRWGVSKYYTGEDFIEKLCSDKEVDAVDIVLPNFLHLKAVQVCAENKKNIIIEKPLGRNLSEAREMLNAVNRNGVLHAYAENQVFIPQIERVMEMVKGRAIGKVFWVRSREAHFGPHSPWFWDKSLSGGGSLLDMGCHSIEVTRKIIGGRAVEVLGWGDLLVHRDRTKAEDNSIVLVRYSGGELGQAENSWAAHGGLDLRYEIYGSEGAIFIDVTRETGIRVFTTAPEERVGYVVEKAEVAKGWLYPIWREFELYGYLNELRHFITSFERGEMPRENFNDGVEVNRIIDAAYRSFTSKKWEPLAE